MRVRTKEKPYVFMMTLLTRMRPTLLPTLPTIQPATANGDGVEAAAADESAEEGLDDDMAKEEGRDGR